MPCFGFQWNFTNVDRPSAFTSRNVWTPKPSMNRNDRGMARSDMAHMSMWVDSGMSETKSQKLSWAVWACGKPRSGSCLAAWIRSGNLIGSWMKNTGMLLPTMSQLPSLGVELHREAAHVAGQVGRSLVAGDGREPHERRGLLAGPLEQVGPGEVGQRLVGLEVPVGAVTRGRGRPARGSARGRSGRSSPGSGSPPAPPAPARRSAACSGRRRPARPAGWSAGAAPGPPPGASPRPARRALAVRPVPPVAVVAHFAPRFVARARRSTTRGRRSRHPH